MQASSTLELIKTHLAKKEDEKAGARPGKGKGSNASVGHSMVPERARISSRIDTLICPRSTPESTHVTSLCTRAQVGKGFLNSLKKLMETLESTDAHFIRCIKVCGSREFKALARPSCVKTNDCYPHPFVQPNNLLVPNLLHGASILNQLKCSGTLEAVELMQKGAVAA